MLRRLVVMVALVSCGMSWAAEQVNLVGEGSAAVVVLPADAKGETLYAAIELSQYVGKITGRDLPLIAEGVGVYQRAARNWQVTPFARLKTRPEGKPEIHVGWTSRALKELDKAKVEKLDVDGFLIKTTSEAIFLVGPKDWSTAYAVFTFLEDFCGVRWFMPGEMGEDVPRASTLAVPLVEKTYEPAYLHRQYSGFQWRNHPELQRWAVHQKVRPRLEYHHNLYAVFDVRKYGAQYPDLYPTIDGRRRIPAAGTSAGWQPCLSHPKAVELAVEYAKEVFTKNPDASSISLGINDGGRYCECERCMKLIHPDAPKAERRAVWFFQFANKVAEQFDQLFPTKVIGYLLYGECHLPPDMKIHRRLIGFEVFPSFRLIVPEHKTEFDARMANLSKNVPVFALYDWFYGDGLCVPRLQIRQAKYWLEHGYKSGARHIKAEAYMNWGLDGFKYWMHTRLMWDPSLDVDKMLDEFFTRFFRESAKPMNGYFKVVERYTVAPIMVRKDDRDVLLNFHFRYSDQLDTFPPKAAEECEPLFDQAEKLAESDLVRRRIQYYRTGFTVAKMMTIRHHLAKDAMPLLEKPETLPQGMPLLARAMSKELDVEQFYKWVLRGDAFCVRYPEDSMFANVMVAQRTAGTTLSQQIAAELQKSRKALTPAALSSVVSGVLDPAWANITDPDALAVAKLTVGPLASKFMLCDKARPPQLDGKLDDACWKNAAVYSDFHKLGTGKPAEFRTEVRASHDGERLYVAVRCHQDTNVLLAWTHGRDDRVWREDGVEFLINRLSDTTKEQRCQIILNTKGNIWDYYNGDQKWDGDIKTGIAIEPTFYTIEASLPLKDIGITPGKERFIRFNVSRNVYARKELRIGEEKEISGWYPSDDNLNPKSRGWLVLNP